MSEEINVETGGGRQQRVRVDYPSNSRKSREAPPEREPVEKVVTGDVIRRKQGSFSKLFRTFVAEDSGSVMGFLLTEVLVPAAKNMISDAMSQGTDRLLYGESRRSGPGHRTAYTSYSRPGTATRQPDPRPQLSKEARASHDFRDIIISSRAEAEDVVDRLRDLITDFQVATVADLYDLVGLTGEFTDNKWGWYDMRSAAVQAVRGGYVLHLPRTQPIV